jgi:hypothetical protein
MLTGRSPFMAGSEYLIFKKILFHADNTDSSVSVIEYPNFIKECEKDFIEALLKGNPALRLGVGVSRYLISDDIHMSQIEEECYNNSNIDDCDGDGDSNDNNNENNINDNNNLKGSNNTDSNNRTCLNGEKIPTITEKKDLKSHNFFENIKWDFLIQNPVPPFWAQTGPAFYPDPLENITEEFKNLYSEFACTISEENYKNDIVIDSEDKRNDDGADIDNNENEILNSNNNQEIINNQEVSSNDNDKIYNNSDNNDCTNDDICPEKCSLKSCSTTSTMDSSIDTFITN